MQAGDRVTVTAWPKRSVRHEATVISVGAEYVTVLAPSLRPYALPVSARNVGPVRLEQPS